MQLDDKAILAAVGEVLAEERNARVELQVRVDDLSAAVAVASGQLKEPGPKGEHGRDGRDGLPGLSGPVGERGERGESGERGMDGPAGPPGESGEKGATGEPAYPGRACGLWNESESYRAMDVVAFNGSEWRAVYDNPGPLPGDGWKQGAKGVKGKPGERGEKGDRGMPGVSVVKMVVVDFEIRLLLSDGTQLACNLLPVIERYYQEAVA
jgi:hypothetical protein